MLELCAPIRIWISAIVPTAILIVVSTGPYLTSLARLLHTMPYCRAKGRVRQHRIMNVEEDCSHHMLVTAPLPKFIDTSVKEHRISATRISTNYEELNEKKIHRFKCIAYNGMLLVGHGEPVGDGKPVGDG
jgi:hypothetical protein